MTDQADAALEDDEQAAAAGEDGENPDGGAEPSGKKFGKKKLILFAAIGLFVLVGAGAGVYFSGLLGGKKDGDQADAGGGQTEAPI